MFYQDPPPKIKMERDRATKQFAQKKATKTKKKESDLSQAIRLHNQDRVEIFEEEHTDVRRQNQKIQNANQKIKVDGQRQSVKTLMNKQQRAEQRERDKQEHRTTSEMEELETEIQRLGDIKNKDARTVH